MANGRPLTKCGVDVCDESPLTPNLERLVDTLKKRHGCLETTLSQKNFRNGVDT